ncbi:hypothetical protein N7532_006432 [Penicillium argentinense]|uniref:Uncharacterized protein n=1 Tax=Penicillium argentinense TaxID=1131581 RepID=A0A9W9FFY7_9EURO|nr:uncharacterized protein N7532_006432 [Penicillium argentinense]KAJ5099431.1 hypothetical protein N7532_006432 [Penicillium argentinense]
MRVHVLRCRSATGQNASGAGTSPEMSKAISKRRTGRVLFFIVAHDVSSIDMRRRYGGFESRYHPPPKEGTDLGTARGKHGLNAGRTLVGRPRVLWTNVQVDPGPVVALLAEQIEDREDPPRVATPAQPQPPSDRRSNRETFLERYDGGAQVPSATNGRSAVLLAWECRARVETSSCSNLPTLYSIQVRLRSSTSVYLHGPRRIALNGAAGLDSDLCHSSLVLGGQHDAMGKEDRGEALIGPCRTNGDCDAMDGHPSR